MGLSNESPLFLTLGQIFAFLGLYIVAVVGHPKLARYPIHLGAALSTILLLLLK
jgi:hypothetical protein